jgi:CarD family transcriptional regulator
MWPPRCFRGLLGFVAWWAHEIGGAAGTDRTVLREGSRMSKNGHDFSVGDHVVYPAHGVGQVQGIETQEVAGLKLEVYVITFDHEKMTLRVPTAKAKTAGLRPLAETNVVSQALTTLKGRARVKRTMWSRRAQEYEAKINSGDLISIAEVVRDLHRAENQPEQSYSERQLYESALDRMAREVAAIERIDRDAAITMLNKSLVKAVAA